MTKKSKKGQGPILVKLELPPEIFDVEGAVIFRRKRIPVEKVDQMRAAKESEEVYKHMAYFIPKWEGLVDCDGEPIDAQPADNPDLFGSLDVGEQFPYLVELVKSTFKPDGARDFTPPALT